jgi:type I restriction enzyme M protein
VKLMAKLILLPIAAEIESGTYLLYDGACGTGGMLTVAEETLQALAAEHGKEVATHLYGQEINAETYAIAKADLLMKGEGEAADNIVGGPEYSTLSNDAFPSREFDFMLSNPPYGKSWKTDLDRMGGKGGMTDPRFVIPHGDQSDYSLVTRSSDGQLMFMATLLSKMKRDTKAGSRIAIIHNGSSLFTGDAGQGESNIRRWVIENDWLEAIVALPLNIFYNTGIATYVWVLTNRKPDHRKGKVQLVNATKWFEPLRKNLGNKNCELSEDDITTICNTFLGFDESEHSKVFPTDAFGYWKVTVDRPLRLRSQCTRKRAEELRFASGDQGLRAEMYEVFGEALFEDFPSVRAALERRLSGTSGSEDSSDEESEGGDPPPALVPAAIRKRLLDEKKWRRDDRLYSLGYRLFSELGEEEFGDYNIFASLVDQKMADWGEKLTAGDRKLLLRGLSVADEGAAPVIKKVHKVGARADPLRGLFEVVLDGTRRVVEYEPDSELRDSEQVPLSEVGGIDTFISREVLPHTPNAWYDPANVKLGYEISFIRHFYKLQPLRTLEEIRGDILAIEKETEGLLGEIIGEAVR